MKILSYDSKLVQTFRTLFDYIGLNLMFLLSSIPVITIGTAQVALYTALRAIRRDEPWAALYWKTFITSLKQPTIVWVIFLVPIWVFTINIHNTIALEQKFMSIISCLGLGFVLCVASLSAMFFSRFDCTVKEMIFNSVRMIFAFPLRIIIGTVLFWAPFAFLTIPMLNWIIFEWIFVFALIYFSLIGAFFNRMMRNPFGRLTGEVPEKEDSYLVREAKKRLAKFEEGLPKKEEKE